jgi:hypothetical protein
MINTFSRPCFAAPFFQFSAPPMKLQDRSDVRLISPHDQAYLKTFVLQVNAPIGSAFFDRPYAIILLAAFFPGMYIRTAGS